MKERERIAKILTRSVSPVERNQQPSNAVADIENFIRIKEALLELAESLDNHMHYTRHELSDKPVGGTG